MTYCVSSGTLNLARLNSTKWEEDPTVPVETKILNGSNLSDVIT